jgi:hypothetical protein
LFANSRNGAGRARVILVLAWRLPRLRGSSRVSDRKILRRAPTAHAEYGRRWYTVPDRHVLIAMTVKSDGYDGLVSSRFLKLLGEHCCKAVYMYRMAGSESKRGGPKAHRYQPRGL